MHKKYAFCRAAVCWQIARCASDRICATRCSVSMESRFLLDAVLPIHSTHNLYKTLHDTKLGLTTVYMCQSAGWEMTNSQRIVML